MSAATEPRLNCEPSLDVMEYDLARDENAIDHHPVDDIEPESTGLDLGGGALEVCRLALAMGADRFILLAAAVCNPRASVRALGRAANVGHSTAQRRVDALLKDYPLFSTLFPDSKQKRSQQQRRKNEAARDNPAICEGATTPANDIQNSIGAHMTAQREIEQTIARLGRAGLAARRQKSGESDRDYIQHLYSVEAEAFRAGRNIFMSKKDGGEPIATGARKPQATPKPAPRNDAKSIISGPRTIADRHMHVGPAVEAKINGVDVTRYQAIAPDPEQMIHDNGDLTPTLDIYHNLTDPRLKTRFWNEHRTAIQSELMLAASVKARLDDQLQRKQNELAGKQAAVKAQQQAQARKQADAKVEALRKTLSSASKATLNELKTALAGMEG